MPTTKHQPNTPASHIRHDLEESLVALDDARVATSAVIQATMSDVRISASDRVLSEVWDDEHGVDQFEVERHHAEALHAQAVARMRSIHRAYERVADQSFGTCVTCHLRIPTPRLLAVPETPWCIDCVAGAGRLT